MTIVPSTLPQLTISNASAIEGDPTAHYRGAAAWGPTATRFNPVTIGPDGNIYTASGNGFDYNSILRYNGTTGAFMGVFATGPMNGAKDIVFHNGYMYVVSPSANQVLQFNATTGAYIGVFVAAGSGGLNGLDMMTFGPDGNLYVSGTNSNNVIEYSGTDRHHHQSEQRQRHLDRGQRHGQGLPVHRRREPYFGQPERRRHL